MLGISLLSLEQTKETAAVCVVIRYCCGPEWLFGKPHEREETATR